MVWYPSVTLLGLGVLGEWGDVLGMVRRELERAAASVPHLGGWK